MMVDSIQVSLHAELPEVRLVEKLSGSLWSWVCHPYIESATALSYYFLLLEKWFPLQGERAHPLNFFCLFVC